MLVLKIHYTNILTFSDSFNVVFTEFYILLIIIKYDFSSWNTMKLCREPSNDKIASTG